MKLNKKRTIAEIARNLPSAVRFFEKVGIDYCCGGTRSLETACETANVDVHTVLSALETLQESGAVSVEEDDWNSAPLSELITHIVDKHHTVVQGEVPRMVELIGKMCTAHSEKRPEFLEVRDLVHTLQSELDAHLKKEEEILFPYVYQLEQSIRKNAPQPSSCFGKINNPIKVMEREHDNAGKLLGKIRFLLKDRTGCPTCLEFFRTFDNFEKDLHQHIHLENNILFPRGIELESSRAS